MTRSFEVRTHNGAFLCCLFLATVATVAKANFGEWLGSKIIKELANKFGRIKNKNTESVGDNLSFQ